MTRYLAIVLFTVLVLSMMFYAHSAASTSYEAPETATEDEIATTTVLIEAEPEKPTDVEGLIEWYASINGAPQDQAYWIAQCESELVNQCNRQSCTYGIGIYQFIQTTWDNLCTGDVYNIEDNINCGTRLISEGKLSHWGTAETEWGSHACWSPRI